MSGARISRCRPAWVACLAAMAAMLLLPLPQMSARLHAQQMATYSTEAERAFQEGLLYFEAADFAAAARRFEAVLAIRPPSQKSTAAVLMAARSHIRLSRYTDAVRVLRPMFIGFTSSSYLPECLTLFGTASFKAGNRIDAATAWLATVLLHADTALRRGAVTGLTDLCLSPGGIDSLRSAVTSMEHSRTIDSALAFTASALVRCDSLAAARSVLTLVRDTVVRAGLLSMLTPARAPQPATAAAPTAARVDTLTIAVVLPRPLEGGERQYIIDDVRCGIDLALAGADSALGVHIRARVYDGDLGEDFDRFLNHIASDPEVVACIGGIFSEDARMLAARLRGTELPTLLVTATGTDLTVKGGNVFQMNAPFRLRGGVLAQWAAHILHARRAVVIANDAGFPKAIAEGFMAECRRLRIPVVRSLFHGVDEPDLVQRTRDILNELILEDDATVVFHAAGTSHNAAAVLEAVTTAMLPLHMLGAGDYHDPAMLSSFAEYPDSLFFESDCAPDTTNPLYAGFIHGFVDARGEGGPKHALFGGDAAGILVAAVRAGARDRAGILKALTVPYIGLRSTVSFTEQRQNGALTIVRYHRGTARRISTTLE